MTSSDDRLSAYLDGELAGLDRDAFEAELAEDGELAAALESLGSMRSMLRDLPQVEPPEGFLEALKIDLATVQPDNTVRPDNVVALAERRNRKVASRVGSAVAAVAACWLLLVGLAPGIGRIAPPLDDYVTASASAESLGFDPMPLDDGHVDALVMPPEMAGMARMAVYQRGETMRADYQHGAAAVSIYQDKGVVDWDGLPEGETMMMEDDSQMWVGHIGDSTVAVMEHDNTVITVVSEGMDDVMHVAHDLPHDPSEPMGLMDRTQSGLDRVVGWFS